MAFSEIEILARSNPHWERSTYCVNEQCPFTDCEWHSDKADWGNASFANRSGSCKRYMDYIVEKEA